MATTYFRADQFTKTVLGPALAGAQIYVCTQPTNIATLPPSPLANIFSDSAGLVPITQPIISDGFGHTDWYALPGIYTIIVGYGGVISQVYPDQSIGGGVIGPGNPYVAGSNITIVGNVISAVIPGGATFQTNGVNNTDQALLNLRSSDSSLTLTADGVGGVNMQVPPAPAQFGPRPGTSNWRLWSSSGTTTSQFTAESVGCAPGASEDSTTSIAPTATQPAMIRLNCATTAGGSQVIFGDNRAGTQQRNYTLGILSLTQLKAALSSLTNCRFWYVGNDHANSTEGLLVSNNPAVNLVGFRFSTSAGDTNFMAYAGTDATHFTATSTGIAADTNPHVFQIKAVSGGATIQYFIDGVQVASISTNVPAASTLLGSTVSLDNEGQTTALGVALAYSYLETSS